MKGKKALHSVNNSKLVLERFRGNPDLRPYHGCFWISKTVFNPTALYESGPRPAFSPFVKRPLAACSFLPELSLYREMPVNGYLTGIRYSGKIGGLP
jgi:hypothetical protein